MEWNEIKFHTFIMKNRIYVASKYQINE